jgi:hypothetical protein
MSERIDLGGESFPVVADDRIADVYVGDVNAKFNPSNWFGNDTEGGLAEAGFRMVGKLAGDGIKFEPDTKGR